MLLPEMAALIKEAFNEMLCYNILVLYCNGLTLWLGKRVYLTEPAFGSCWKQGERLMVDAVMRLREALEPELTRLIGASRAVDPSADAVTIGSLLLLYGVEIALTVGDIAPERLADYLRAVADSVEERSGALPTLGRLHMEGSDEPTF